MIKIDDLIPLLKDGWVAMESHGYWFWYQSKPRLNEWSDTWDETGFSLFLNNCCFNIEPVEDWKKSLIEIKDGKRV